MGFDECDVRLRGGRLDDYRLKFRSGFCSLEFLLEIGVIDAEAFFDLRQTFRERFRIVAQQKNAEGRIAIHNYAAETIKHRTAPRNDGNRTDLVAFREVGEMFRLHNLQL